MISVQNIMKERNKFENGSLSIGQSNYPFINNQKFKLEQVVVDRNMRRKVKQGASIRVAKELGI